MKLDIAEVLMRRKFVLRAALSVGATLAFLSSVVTAATITPGNLVVIQVGDGSAALASSATAGFAKEFTTAGGAPVQTINLPTSVSGANQQLTYSGTATSEGFLTLSANGQYLTTAGYAANPGTA